MGKPYRECPYCGNNLDHNEKCDCRNEHPQKTEPEREKTTDEKPGAGAKE